MNETHFMRLDANRILPELSAHQCARLAHNPTAGCIDRKAVLDAIRHEIVKSFPGNAEHVLNKIQPRLLVSPGGVVVALSDEYANADNVDPPTFSLANVASTCHTCHVSGGDTIATLEFEMDRFLTRRLALAARALAGAYGFDVPPELDGNHLRNVIPHVARVLAWTWMAEAECGKPSRSFARDDITEMYDNAVKSLEERVPPFISGRANPEEHIAHDLAYNADSICLLFAELEEDP